MELYGYSEEGGMTEQDTVPEYRAVSGRYMDQYNRMLQIDDPELGFVNTYRFRYSVRILEDLAQKTDMQNIRDDDIIQILRKHLKVDVFRFCFSPVEINGILDNIRNRLMEKIRQNVQSKELSEDNNQQERNLKLINGFYWTRNPESKENVAYCPGCVQEIECWPSIMPKR